MFLNTEKYRQCGGENESFIAYGPEDAERYERFHKIDYKVGRVGKLVYHFEHSRTPTSNNQNIYFKYNTDLYNRLSVMKKNEIIEYYKNIYYLKKYEKF